MKEYTASEIRAALDELHITPLKTNKVDSAQAARLLTWRLKQEYGIDRAYTATGIRRRVSTGALPVAETIHARFNLYDVRDVFALSLMPARAEGAKQRVFQHSQKLVANGIDNDT